MKRALITGANGGIGTAMCQEFARNGWEVLATDRDPASRVHSDFYLSMELDRFCIDAAYRRACLDKLGDAMPDGLDCLVNNAAHQKVAAIEDIDIGDWQTTLNANVTAPFLLVQAFLDSLRKKRGSVINITSVHCSLTKSNFSAYATSKSALEGLTRALAVELGSAVRVNAIAPAAIETPMLRAGFEGNPGGLSELAGCHPSHILGQAGDVAELAYFMAQFPSRFLNGAVIGLDGGIASRLHDPA
jgi:NAD(P)-dependent dehydrogenase (short-subunit alcohol dehydrogenase family)